MLADNASGASKIKTKLMLVIWSYTMKKKSEEQVTKKCSKCEVVKPLDEFRHRNDSKDGRRNNCKGCQYEYQQHYHQANREKILECKKQHYQDNKEKKKQYCQDNKEKKKEYDRQYHQEHKTERNKYERNRRADEPGIALRQSVSRHIYNALTRNNGSKLGESVLQYLPYTIEQLKEHLENQFEDWMNWSNHGKWHIDHIYPQSKLPYDSMTHPNFQKCWALENLQPLEAIENIKKGNRLYEREEA